MARLWSRVAVRFASTISRVETNENYARVFFADGGNYADYHFFWLRHNCESSRHPKTNERTLCLSRVPLDIRPELVSVCADGKALDIVWDREIGVLVHVLESLSQMAQSGARLRTTGCTVTRMNGTANYRPLSASWSMFP